MYETVNLEDCDYEFTQSNRTMPHKRIKTGPKGRAQSCALQALIPRGFEPPSWSREKGRAVEVLWRGTYYAGVIDCYDPKSRRSHVVYGDTSEWLWCTGNSVRAARKAESSSVHSNPLLRQPPKPPPFYPEEYGMDDTFFEQMESEAGATFDSQQRRRKQNRTCPYSKGQMVEWKDPTSPLATWQKAELATQPSSTRIIIRLLDGLMQGQLVKAERKDLRAYEQPQEDAAGGKEHAEAKRMPHVELEAEALEKRVHQGKTWLQYIDDSSHKKYWFCLETETSSWELPWERPTWQAYKSDTGDTYYFNRITNESTWERPAELGGPVKQEPNTTNPAAATQSYTDNASSASSSSGKKRGRPKNQGQSKGQKKPKSDKKTDTAVKTEDDLQAKKADTVAKQDEGQGNEDAAKKKRPLLAKKGDEALNSQTGLAADEASKEKSSEIKPPSYGYSKPFVKAEPICDVMLPVSGDSVLPLCQPCDEPSVHEGQELFTPEWLKTPSYLSLFG